MEDHRRQFIFHFAPVKPSQRSLVHNWLKQTHTKEWIHGIGLQSTLTGIENFLQGGSSATYWIGYDRAAPFAFLITSPSVEDAIALDVFICDLKYLGKRLAVPLIHEFLIGQFPDVKRILIDPEAANTRAIHVYKKAGFKIVGEFIASWHPVLHYQMELNMSDLLTFNTEHH
ncbi:MAG: GNAT family N-acetyltransferase [Ignavibacteriae bacterium]|nr:GNAT family N-acetyltransferase [Ignavibacteriota bacterium]